MRALLCVRPWELAVVERSRPSPGPVEALARIRRAGVCGADLHVYEGSPGFEVGRPSPSSDRSRNPFLDHRLAKIFTPDQSKKQRHFGALVELSVSCKPAASQRSARFAQRSRFNLCRMSNHPTKHDPVRRNRKQTRADMALTKGGKA